MLPCWSINDALRPSFETLAFRLTEVYKLMTWNATEKEVQLCLYGDRAGRP